MSDRERNSNGFGGALSRRTFIRVAAGSAVALPAILAACGTEAPAASSSPVTTSSAGSASVAARASSAGAAGATSAGASAAAKPSSVFPTYIPITNGPKPDYPSAGQLYEDGFDLYPKNAVKSWTKDPPGLGSKITAFTNGYNPPSAPFDNNPTWKEVNKQLNANVQFNVVQPGDYAIKLSTMMAGGDLTDILLFPNALNVTGLPGAANMPAFLQSQCADLAPYLAGDAIKDYPNLAAIPTLAWQNSGSVLQNHIYMVPLSRYVVGTCLFKNSNVYDAEIGKDYVPKDAADLKKVYQQLNKPQDGRYATAAYQNTGYHIAFYAALHGAPNNWKLDNGKFIKDWETPEFKEAIAYARDLVVAGVFHPNTAQYTDINAARADFVSGRFVLYPEGFGQPWQDFGRRGLLHNPPFTFAPLPPFAAHAGGKPTHFLGAGFLVGNALKKAAPERIKEILRVMDFLAAPFGTQEDLLLQYGLPGTDYNLDDKGTPKLTDKSNINANYVNWKYIEQHPQVMYVPDIPGYAKAEYDAEHAIIPFSVSDPSYGVYSSTQGQKGQIIRKTVIDGITDIVAGRRPISDFDQLVKDWGAAGGELIRKELQDAIAAK